MALGLEHSVLLLSDGDAVAFGRNSYGQCAAEQPRASFVGNVALKEP